jgi:hypothetical protein
MPIALALVDSWHDSKRLHVILTPTFSGSYSTGGDTLSFAGVKGVLSSQPPVEVVAHGNSGHLYEFVFGTTIANGLLIVRIATSTSGNLGLSQHSAAAYDATVTADVVRIHAIFRLR